MGEMNYTSDFAILKIKKIKRLLHKKAMSTKELSETLHFSVSNISGYLRHLKRKHLVYIVSYRKVLYNNKRLYCPFYKLGSLPDAIKPIALTSTEKMKISREKLLSDPAARDFLNARRRALNVKPQIDWVTNWIPR